MIEITVLAKTGGPLTKRISISPDGSLCSDGSACIMSTGAAARATFDSLSAFATCISGLRSDQAIALGTLRDGLPDQVRIRPKAALNGHDAPDMIARTGDHIVYRPGQPALVLIDVDTKGMSTAVKQRVDCLGGFQQALVSVLPALETAGTVSRNSTSAGISRTDSGDAMPGSNGVHTYVLVTDGTDAERFLRALHERCWLAGLGWLMVGAAGQLLDRSLVDRMVAAPERLVFEGAPVVDPPLAQDPALRIPEVMAGPAIDSRAVCPDLGVVDQARLRDLRAVEARRLAPASAAARNRYIAGVAERTGCTRDDARHMVERQCNGILLPRVVLAFDAVELEGTTVADVLADPARFVGNTLADPVEGVAYGRCKARVMQRGDGTVWIHSFAHGRSIYDLKLDAAAVEVALNEAATSDVVSVFVRRSLTADLGADELERLRDLASRLAGVGKRAVSEKLKAARAEQKKQQAREEQVRRTAERTDPRPQIPAPMPDAPWLPQMQSLNDVLGASCAAEPVMRNVEGYATMIHVRRVPGMHTLTAHGANEGETEENRLPAPEEPLLSRLDEAQLAELIEQHIDYVDEKMIRSVHLPTPFVKHFQKRTDHALPVVTSVATLPIVLADGTILSGRGLDRKRGIVFRVPEQLEALLPIAKTCSATPVANAIQFLTDEWLTDVATDYAGKCVLIALALSIIERAALPERPAFFASAGHRGSGKTTVINMISMAVLGRRAAASAWSASEEERRKALFAYLGEGVAVLAWDNIPRGAAISCPSIEKALTTENYKDRVLGVSENRTVPASTIQVFTGNNITSRGDMASRSLTARLSVDRPDPENREFKHPDPIAWTEANRGNILSALYTVLLGNPRLTATKPAAPETRFKMWWHLVGAAVEHAAKQHLEHVEAMTVDPDHDCPPASIAFRKLFLDGEADEEQTSSLGIVLRVLHTEWPSGCQARDIAAYAGRAEEDAIEFKAALEQASGKAIKVVTATIITWRLKALIDAPVQIDDAVVALRYLTDDHGGTFTVKTIR
jgi:hypothetical protein